MTVIMDGKRLAQVIRRGFSARWRLERKAGIVAILVGNDHSSKKYVELKERDCRDMGIHFQIHHFDDGVSNEELLSFIGSVNTNTSIHGIIVQLPLPQKLDENKLLSEVNPAKDIDGLHPQNIGRLWSGDYEFDRSLLPCTPRGIMLLLNYYEIGLAGKRAVIVNRSNLVGKPLAKLLLDRDATVTICHSKTKNIEDYAYNADILVSAVGRYPKFKITEDMVNEGAVVIDVGMSYVDGKLHGDVDFENVGGKCSYITPMPGGVGPMTRAALLQNVLIAAGGRA
jgi:methylenetetrahydrofolate dehydrogenase (NADP+)/methenyltetrahydrofolate cyclohydrolase